MVESALYVVSTPIGNLDDMTPRAVQVLSDVDLIAAEDTRHSGRLLQHFSISTRTMALHDHNERQVCGRLVERLQSGESIALISDAGTPLVNDPGYHLVHAAHQNKIKVVPVVGACAAIAALSVSGLASDRFAYEGFLPAKAGTRVHRLESLKDEARTLIFYEAPHRIIASLESLVLVLGHERIATLARELTKRFETVKQAPLGELLEWVRTDPNQQKGEIVLVVQGAPSRDSDEGIDSETQRILTLLLEELPTRQAAALAAKITGLKKNTLYKEALQIVDKGELKR
ncbi:MAG: 16S rRNA (cytidine(1402)-2'-O)-methyltransferase [Gammaproteobacteria bacterium]|nr:16S rRNA (cytidine(1402)-2'-O)-methyltransferase [Gammaproteobacteria bacterium]